MTYRIKGLEPAAFAQFFAMDEAELARHGAHRVIADADFGYSCRVSLEDAAAGETLLLLNHVSHDVAGPYHAAHAIQVREAASAPAALAGTIPPVFASRTLSLRGFDAAGDLVASRVSAPGDHDGAIRALLDDLRIDHIDAHNAGHGCFAARIERCKEAA